MIYNKYNIFVLWQIYVIYGSGGFKGTILKFNKFISVCTHYTVYYHSFMQRPVHPLFGWVKPVLDG